MIGLKKQGELKQELRCKEAEKALLLQYIRYIESGGSLSESLVGSNIRNLAVYGCNEYSDIVYEALKDSGCMLSYIIAGNLAATAKDIRLLTMKDNLPHTDAVMICELFGEDRRKKELLDKGFERIITFSDVVYGKIK